MNDFRVQFQIKAGETERLYLILRSRDVISEPRNLHLSYLCCKHYAYGVQIILTRRMRDT
jgi:hypothetical protein